MKNQSPENVDEFFQKAKVETSNEKKLYFEEVTCIEGKKCIFVCADKDCFENALVCGSSKCKCRKLHEKNGQECFLVEPEKLVGKVENKCLDDALLTNHLNGIITNFIDWVSGFQERFKYLGLNQFEVELLKTVKSGKVDSLQGNKLSQICRRIYEPKKSIDIEPTIKEIDIYWNKQFDDIKSKFQKIEGIALTSHLINRKSGPCSEEPLSLKMLSSGKLLMQTQILQTEKDLSILTQFLQHMKKVQSYTLMYRASQNNFKVSKFFDSCKSMHNLLVLVKTEKDKIIGGFTSEPWTRQSPSYHQTVGDFCIFSVSNKHRFSYNQQKQTRPIFTSNPQYGPYFGKDVLNSIFSISSDLAICDEANRVKMSQCLTAGAYFNNKYLNNDEASYMAFTGEKGSQFLVKEWEVFRVEFKKGQNTNIFGRMPV